MAPACRGTQFVLEGSMQSAIYRIAAVRKSLDQPFARGRVRCISDLLALPSKELLLLKLDPLPWRVPNHTGETALPASVGVVVRATIVFHTKNVGKLQMPMEEPVPLDKTAKLLGGRARYGVTLIEPIERLGGDCFGRLDVLAPYKGGTPRICYEFAVSQFRGMRQFAVATRLGADIGKGTDGQCR